MNTFKYIQPKDLKEASKILKSGLPESIAFAGGTDVLGLIKNGIASPEKVVNLKQIQGMSGIKFLPGKGIEIGALTTLVEIAENKQIKEKYNVLAQAASEIASPQFRNVATLGGNLCQRPRCFYFRGDFHCLRKGGDLCYAVDGNNKFHCIIGGGPCYIVHPSVMAVALLALDASVSIYSGGKSKIIPLKEFFILPE